MLQDPVSWHRDLRAKLEVAITHTLELAQQQQQQQKEWQQNSSDSEEFTSDTDEVRTKRPDTAKPENLQQALDTEQLLVWVFFLPIGGYFGWLCLSHCVLPLPLFETLAHLKR